MKLDLHKHDKYWQKARIKFDLSFDFNITERGSCTLWEKKCQKYGFNFFLRPALGVHDTENFPCSYPWYLKYFRNTLAEQHSEVITKKSDARLAKTGDDTAPPSFDNTANSQAGASTPNPGNSCTWPCWATVCKFKKFMLGNVFFVSTVKIFPNSGI